jgi:hypothetical protein
LGLLFIAGAYLVYQAAMLAASEKPATSFGPPMAARATEGSVLAVGDIGQKDDINIFIKGQRPNPFAPFGGGSGYRIAIADVRPKVPVRRTPVPKPPVRRPKRGPSPPKPAPQQPKPPPKPAPAPKPSEGTGARKPEPWKLPVALSGVFSVDGERYVVMKIKDNQYYLRAQPGERLDDLGIEVVEVRGEEVLLRSIKTGEVFLLRDLVERLRKEKQGESGEKDER